MPSFGSKSRKELDSCSPNLQRLAEKAIQLIDFSVVQGERTVEEQHSLFKRGRAILNGSWAVVDPKQVVTQIDGINRKGMHNYEPSLAYDLAPYPIDWSNKPKAVARFYLLAGVMLALAWIMGIQVRWGGDWDGDWDLADQKFDDLGHFEEIV